MRNKNQKSNNWFDDYMTYKLVTKQKSLKEARRTSSHKHDTFRLVRNSLIAVAVIESIGALIKIFY